MTNRNDGPKSFSEAMYRKVGLTTHQGSRGQAQQQPSDYNATHSYRVTDDHQDIGVQRRLAGLTERREMHFPNPSGAVQLRPVDGYGILDIESTLSAIGLTSKTARLFESRTTEEVEQESHQARLGLLRARREELDKEINAIDQQIQEYEDHPLAYGRGKDVPALKKYSKKALRRRTASLG